MSTSRAYIVVSALTGQSEEEKERVDELFEEALPPVKRQALGLPPLLAPVVVVPADAAVTSDRELV